MLGMLIIAHAPLASALKSVACHTFPQCAAQLEALDVPANMPCDQIEALALAALQRVRNPDAIVFTDVFGATPCNVAQRIAALSDVGSVKVIAGVNVPMLWRSLCYSHEGIDAVVARAVAGALGGVMPLHQPEQGQPTQPALS